MMLGNSPNCELFLLPVKKVRKSNESVRNLRLVYKSRSKWRFYTDCKKSSEEPSKTHIFNAVVLLIEAETHCTQNSDRKGQTFEIL